MHIIRIPLLFLLLCSLTFAQYSKVVEKENKLYLSNTVVLKLKTPQRQQGMTDLIPTPSLNSMLNNEKVESIHYLFNEAQYKNNIVLREVAVVKYSSNTDPELLSAKLNKLPEVDWCEPWFVYEVDFTPNDPMLNTQWHLTKINAAQAWDITKGDSSIAIGIVDTGVDWDHPDLAANIWRNSDEIPGNGVDDDGNGFNDDIRGWDFGGVNGTPDNNPMEDRPDHGTHVAGIASAVTNNSVGVASIGFNCRIIPVKTSRDDMRNQNGQALIVYGNEGILYAANNGAKVINLSWGGEGYSILSQQVINQAVSLGAVIVAAAGNNANSVTFYPSAYDGVLSVASTTSDDIKSGFSSFGTYVDVSAPGSSINSTWQNDSYFYGSGTSMASPLAAGLAALVVQQFPLFNPLQVIEQVRVNSDDISSLNPAYNFLLGKGRINAFNTVANTTSKSVRAQNFVFNDDAPNGDGDGVFEPGEIISAGARFTNYLNTVNNLSITLEELNNYSSVVNGIFNAGQKGTLEIFDNYSSEFTFQLNSSIPANTELLFKINYSDGTYDDFQLFKVVVNPSYANQYNGNILLTVTSDGTLGFNDFPTNSKGSGFKYMNGENLLFEGALMIGTSAIKLSDAARTTSVRHFEFFTEQPFILEVPGTSADQEGSTLFNDNPAGTNKLGVTVNLKSYSYSNDEDDDYIILSYKIKNNSGAAISGLYAGLFFDWDFADAGSDSTGYDAGGSLGYVYRTAGNPSTWVGTAVVSSSTSGFYAIKNDGTQGNINLFDADGFTDQEKWTTISTASGIPGTGPGDISHVVSSGPFNINSGDSVITAFAISAGENLDDIRNAAARARVKFQQILTDIPEELNTQPVEFSLSQNYPNPFNPSTIISYDIKEPSYVSLRIYDITGQLISTLVNELQSRGNYNIKFDAKNFPSGIYFYELKAGEFKAVRKMTVIR